MQQLSDRLWNYTQHLAAKVVVTKSSLFLFFFIIIIHRHKSTCFHVLPVLLMPVHTHIESLVPKSIHFWVCWGLRYLSFNFLVGWWTCTCKSGRGTVNTSTYSNQHKKMPIITRGTIPAIFFLFVFFRALLPLMPPAGAYGGRGWFCDFERHNSWLLH